MRRRYRRVGGSNQRVGGAIVLRVEHETTKRTGVVRMDKGSMTFFARAIDGDVQSAYFEDKEASKVRDWLYKELSKTGEADKLEWVPVIAVKYDIEAERYYYGNRGQEKSAKLELSLDRYWLALTNDKREWRKLEWSQGDPEASACVRDEDRHAQSEHHAEGPKHQEVVNGNRKPFQVPSFQSGYRREESTLAYTPELWAALLMLARQIENSGKELQRLVSTQRGVEELRAVGAGEAGPLLLAAGKSGK